MWKKIIIVFASILILTGLGFLLFPPISNFIGNQIANSEADKFDTIVENVVDNGKSYEDALKDKEIDEEGYPLTRTEIAPQTRLFITKRILTDF